MAENIFYFLLSKTFFLILPFYLITSNLKQLNMKSQLEWEIVIIHRLDCVNYGLYQDYGFLSHNSYILQWVN